MPVIRKPERTKNRLTPSHPRLAERADASDQRGDGAVGGKFEREAVKEKDAEHRETAQNVESWHVRLE